MAVLLCRDGKPFTTPVPSELRGLPRISLDYEPVPNHSSYLGKPVVTRTQSRFACLEQPREKTRKDLHDRHRLQLTQCGFHAPSSKVYKELGSVELDDARLILETLGQAKKEQDTGVLQPSNLKLAKFEQQPPFMVSPYQVKIHSKISSQFPSELLHLDDKIKQGEHQLGHMKKGRSLFKLMEEDQKNKEKEEEARLRKDQSAALYQWKEAEVTVDLSGMENGFPLSPEPQNQQANARKKRSPQAMGDVEELEPSAVKITCTDEGGGGVASAESVIEEWYRKLCVMVWILKAMQLESAHHSIPLSKCWDLNPQYVDDSTGKRRYDYSTRRLAMWEEWKKRTIVKPKSFRAKVATIMAFRSLTPVRTPVKKARSTEIPNEPSLESQAGSTMSQAEEEELKRQERFKRNVAKRWTARVPAITLDLTKTKAKFFDSDEKRRMVVHEQLAAMERDRVEALQQRLGALKVTVNMWNDLAAMREGLEIESTTMARKKLLMNYKWYEELIALLPEEVNGDYYCQELLKSLSEIAEYMCSAGPGKMSRRKLIQVLATLDPWELQAPDIGGAVQHLIQHVIYVAEEDYKEWLKQHTAVYHYHHPQSKDKNTPNHAGARDAHSPGGKISPAPSPGRISHAGAKNARGGRISNAGNKTSSAGGKISNAGGRIGSAGGKSTNTKQ